MDLLPKTSKLYGRRSRLSVTDLVLIGCFMSTLFLLTYWITPLFGLIKPTCLLTAFIVSLIGGLSGAWTWLYPESETILGNCIGFGVGAIGGGIFIGSGLTKSSHGALDAIGSTVEVGVLHLQRPFVTGLFLGVAYLSLWSIIRLMILRIIRPRNPEK